MLKTYKYYILAGLFVVYSLGLWNVCSKYKEASFLKDQVALQQTVIETQEQRAQLADKIGSVVEDKLSKIQITQKTINQKVIHEITKEPVYTECVTTPDGMRLIEDAIGNKGSSTNK